jgi:hypothetical protein
LSTAKAIDSITDPSEFERLMNSILRRSNPKYLSIIETGINIEGKTIKGRVDAFGRVLQSSKPEYILIAHTTTKKEDLEIKWLNEAMKKEGDLIKAGKEAEFIRERIPEAKFTLVLTTNRRFTSIEDEPLYIKLETKAKEFGIKLDIWEQSRIVDYLDNEPYGHWFRKKFLGITAELLSKPLLLEICKKSFEAYSHILFNNNDQFIHRDYDGIIEESILNTQVPIHLIVGESGVGKSTITYKLLERSLKNKTYALWIPAEIIKGSVSIESAVNNYIISLQPTISPESINQIINEIGDKDNIILIIDDINNLDKPQLIVKKLISWSKPAKDKKSNFSIICPLWPSIWNLISYENKKNEWINVISIGLFIKDEGQKAVQLITDKAGFQISSIKARNLAKKLGNDPFLIGSFGAVISSEDEQMLDILTNNVLDNYLLKETERISSQYNFSFLPQEYQAALDSLCSTMLYKKKFFPKLHEIKEWFISEPDMIDVIRELIKDQKLCKLDENGTFIFKHDRLLNYLHVQALVNLIHSNEDINIILSEPYYADIIGQAILKAPNSVEILLKLYEMNILSLFESMKYFGTNSSSNKDEITKLILTWTQNKENFDYKSTLESVYHSLIEIDSEIVINITENTPKNFLTLLARLRNGCALSGIEYCLLHREFEPTSNFPLRDLIIEQAKVLHDEKIQKDLIKLLVSDRITDEQRAGSLILIGFFQFDNCEEEIIRCWNLSENKEYILNAALWAGMNCFRQNIELYFNPLITFWNELPGYTESEVFPLKDQVADNLRLAFGYKRKMNKEIINYLISICESKKSLTLNIMHIFNYIDDPEAVEFVVRMCAETGRSTLMYTNQWDVKIFDYAHRLSEESRSRLKSLWVKSFDDKTKKAAFSFWSLNIEQSELNLLRQIPPTSPLSHDAILKRVELRDNTVVQDYISLLYSDPYFFSEAHNVWCDEIMEVARSYLISVKDSIPSDFTSGKDHAHFFLRNLLLFIPEKDAETLLNDYWEHLKFDPYFIHAALYVGTPRCLVLADLVIKEYSTNTYLFKHIMSTFSSGFKGYRKTFTEKKINNLLPYLSLFKDEELSDLVSSCEHNDLLSWARNHLYKLLSDKYKKYYFPTDNDLINELKTESKKKHGFTYIEHVWIEKFEERNDPKSRIFRIFEMLLESEPTVDNLHIAALCIKAKGNRSDINILKNYNILGNKKEVSKIIRDTEYFLCRKALN